MNTRYRFLHICKVLELLLHLLDKISPYLTSRDPEIGHFFGGGVRKMDKN